MHYKYFGLLAAITLAAGLLFIVRTWPSGRHKTFSQHIASKRSSIIYYMLLFGIALPLLVIFFVCWFTPTFALTPWINVFVILSALFQLACTFVPEVGGRMTTWHRSLAGLSAVLLVPILVLIIFSDALSALSRALTVAALIAMGYCIYLVSRSKGEPRNFLIIQCTYFTAFLAPILAISYLLP